MKYFNHCSTLDEVKKLYRQLAKQHHPDKGGDLATMQAINNEYTKAIVLIAKGYTKQDGTRYTDQEAESEILNAEAYRNAVNSIINIEGITIELCGSYIWVTPVDDSKFWDFWPEMKKAGYFFAKVKRQYYFRTAEYATSNNRVTLTKGQIRTKYGSQIINRSNSQTFLHA